MPTPDATPEAVSDSPGGSDPPPRPAMHLIEDVAQLDALASPARLEIVQVLEGAPPMSVAEIAAELGRAPDGLYFHLRRLAEVGLIEACDVVATNGHTVRGYRAVADHLRTVYRPGDPEACDALERTIGASLRLTERDIRTALARGDAVTRGPERDTFLGRMKGWVTPEEHVRINALIAEIVEIVNAERRAPGRRQMTVTIGLSCGTAEDSA